MSGSQTVEEDRCVNGYSWRQRGSQNFSETQCYDLSSMVSGLSGRFSWMYVIASRANVLESKRSLYVGTSHFSVCQAS